MKKDKYFSIIFYKFVSNDGCISTAFWIHVTYYSSTVELIWFFVISGFFLKFLIWCLAKFLAFSFSHSSTCLAFAIGVGGCCYYIYIYTPSPRVTRIRVTRFPLARSFYLLSPDFTDTVFIPY